MMNLPHQAEYSEGRRECGGIHGGCMDDAWVLSVPIQIGQEVIQSLA